LLAADVRRVGRPGRDEPGLDQDLLGRDVVVGGGGRERAEPVPFRRELAQVPHGRGRHAAPSGVLRDPVAEFRRAVPDAVQVEPAQDRAVVGDEHVVGAAAGFLLGQHGAVPAGELVEVLIAAVGDGGGEVGAVRQLEGQDRLGMVRAKKLQLGHPPNSTQLAPATPAGLKERVSPSK
jgi:hypothetical protein